MEGKDDGGGMEGAEGIGVKEILDDGMEVCGAVVVG